MPIDPISAGFGLVGLALDIFGGSEEEDAAKRMYKAETNADRLMVANTAKTNALYKKKASADYKTAKEKQKVYKAYAEDFKSGAKETADAINDFVMKSTAAQNKAVDARQQANEAELQQGRLNNLRERRAAIREASMQMSAIIAGAANKGALGGSGVAAGKGDTTAQLARHQVASYQNLSVMDQMDAANRLYAAMITEANDYEARRITESNRWDYEKTRMELKLGEKYYAADVKNAKASTNITNKIYDLNTQAARIQSNRNRQVAGAKDQAAEAGVITDIGKSAISFGLDLFK